MSRSRPLVLMVLGVVLVSCEPEPKAPDDPPSATVPAPMATPSPPAKPEVEPRPEVAPSPPAEPGQRTFELDVIARYCHRDGTTTEGGCKSPG